MAFNSKLTENQILLTNFGFATIIELPNEQAPELLEPKVFNEIIFEDLKALEKTKSQKQDSVKLEKQDSKISQDKNSEKEIEKEKNKDNPEKKGDDKLLFQFLQKMSSQKDNQPGQPKPSEQELEAPLDEQQKKGEVEKEVNQNDQIPNEEAQQQSSKQKQEAEPPKQVVEALKQEAEVPKQEAEPPKQIAEVPKQDAVAPKQEAEPPKQIAEVPKQEAEAPKQEAEAPKQEAEPPKQEVEVPKQQAEPPKQVVEAPKQEAEPPKQIVEVPKQVVEAPKQEVEAPKQEVEAPKQEAEPPKQAVEAPKQEAEALKQEAEPLKQEVEAKKQEAEAQKQQVEPPKQEEQPPKQQIELPKQEVEPPKQEAEPPKNDIDAPKQQVEPLNQEADAPNQKIEAPKQEAEPPKNVIEAPKQEIEAPKQAVEPLKNEIEAQKLEAPKVDVPQVQLVENQIPKIPQFLQLPKNIEQLSSNKKKIEINQKDQEIGQKEGDAQQLKQQEQMKAQSDIPSEPPKAPSLDAQIYKKPEDDPLPFSGSIPKPPPLPSEINQKILKPPFVLKLSSNLNEALKQVEEIKRRKMHLHSNDDRSIALALKQAPNAKVYCKVKDVNDCIYILVKTLFANRNYYLACLPLNSNISQLRQLVVEASGQNPKMLHNIKIIHPIGQLKEMKDQLICESSLNDFSQLLFLVQMTFFWDPNKKGKSITLSNSNLSANKKGEADYQTILGTLAMSSGKHYWEIKIDKFVDEEDLFIGIARKEIDLYVQPTTTGLFWGYMCLCARKFGSEGVLVNYGYQAKATDVIGVLLEFRGGIGTLSFYRNGAKCGEAFNNLTGTFFPAVSMFYGEVQITLDPKAPLPMN